MWQLDPKELLVLKRAGGERFAEFVDALIRGEAEIGGLPQSEIDTQVRVNIRDGGIDTVVRRAVLRDESGYLSEPTCWQYKSGDIGGGKTAERELVTEIHKPEAERLICAGYGYRYCLLDAPQPDVVARWEARLQTEARKIHADALIPRVVAIDKLAVWAGRFLAAASLVREFPKEVWNSEALARNIRALRYVPVARWIPISEAIRRHVDFNVTPMSACLSLQGEAGVGKTRLVSETLLALEGISPLLAYVKDEQRAFQLSFQLGGSQVTPRAVIVADECSLETRLRIEANLEGCSHRVRFICIDNTGRRNSYGTPEWWLDEMPRDAVGEILAANFPDVPAQLRDAYIQLTGGFVRLAAEMCRYNVHLAGGDLSVALSNVEEWIKVRINDPKDAKVLDMLALFTRVGAFHGASGQLNRVCAIVGLDVAEAVETARRLKDSPGFVNIAGRFLYVTPAIVARVAFSRGWNRWLSEDPKGFFEKLDADLAAAFLDRVRDVGTQEVKAALAATFRDWLTNLKPSDLTDAAQTERLGKLVEADPAQYLPFLRRLVDAATPEQLRSGQPHGWTPRRTLVWLCERLAGFSEYYHDAEAILFRLSANESEQNLGNNASGIWRQLQRIYLSGSSLPFRDRFSILRRRLEEVEGEQIDLCLDGLAMAFASHVTRMASPPTVGGRLRPPDWSPSTLGEIRECWILVLNTLRDLVRSKNVSIKAKSVKVALTHVAEILRNGFLDELRAILKDNLGGDVLSHVMRQSEGYLRWQTGRGATEADRAPEEYLKRVNAWLDDIRPKSFEGRLRDLLSRDMWDEEVREELGAINPNIALLAKELTDRPVELSQALPFLMTKAAKSAVLLGDALGRNDPHARLIATIFGAIDRGSDVAFVRGYTFGLLRAGGAPIGELEKWITVVEQIDARFAFDIRLVGGAQLHAFDNTMRLVEAGKLPVTLLTAFADPSFLGDDRNTKFEGILSALVSAAEAGDQDARESAIKVLWNAVGGVGARQLSSPPFRRTTLRKLAWRLISLPMPDQLNAGAFEVAEVLERLAVHEPARAIGVLTKEVVAHSYGQFHDHSYRVLLELVKKHPAKVMATFGKQLLAKKQPAGLWVSRFTGLVVALPATVVTSWVRANGVRAARALARHLPDPYVDEQGNAVVPKATLGVLKEFGDDEVTCADFVAPGASYSWMGNGGDYFRGRANTARRFIENEIECIRKWALREVAWCGERAKEEQLWYEERVL